MYAELLAGGIRGWPFAGSFGVQRSFRWILIRLKYITNYTGPGPAQSACTGERVQQGWLMHDAGHFRKYIGVMKQGKLPVANPAATRTITIPREIGDKKMHLILEVHDKGTPALVTYRRVVIQAN
jgi:hypothetical protein